MHIRLPALVAVASSLIIALIILGAVPKQEIPPFPMVYFGDVVVQEQPAPEGISLVACVGGCENWESEPVLTLENGRYAALTVRAPEALLRQEITFWIVVPEEPESRRIKAQQTDSYDPDFNVIRTFDLSFDDPIPTPLPPPTNTPTPMPTDTPPPTATAIPPVPGDPSVGTLSRVAVFVGIGALLVGGTALYLMRRRRAF